MNESYRARTAKLRMYRKLWEESEWVLNVLRTQSKEPLERATDEEVLRWAERLTQKSQTAPYA